MAPVWLLHSSGPFYAAAAFMLARMSSELNPWGTKYRDAWRQCSECGFRLQHAKGCSRR